MESQVWTQQEICYWVLEIGMQQISENTGIIAFYLQPKTCNFWRNTYLHKNEGKSSCCQNMMIVYATTLFKGWCIKILKENKGFNYAQILTYSFHHSSSSIIRNYFSYNTNQRPDQYKMKIQCTLVIVNA